MTNDLAVLIYSSLLIINLILVGSVMIKRGKATFDYAYIGTCLLIVGWLVCELMTFVLGNPIIVGYLYTARLALVVFIPLIFVNLIAAYYNLHRYISQWGGKLLFVIAVLFALLALTNPLHELLRSNVSVEMGPPLTLVHATSTIWFYVLLGFMQIPVIGAASIVFYQRKKLPAVYRRAVTLLLWCLVIYIASVFLFLSGALDDSAIDPSLIALCVINFLFFIAVAGHARADYLSVWRDDVFDYLEEGILIVNGKGKIVDANQQAERLFDFVGIKVDGLSVDDLWLEIAAAEKAFFRKLEGEDRETVSSDLYVLDGEYPVIYEIQRSAIHDEAKAGSGEFIILTEVTRNRLYIERLKDLAGVDALTGLPNRYRYEQILLEWDRPESLPLSIIMGDVNDLKKMNDEYGHLVGDELLKQTASILRDSCPNGGLVARIGGDEFIMILKNHSKEDAAVIIKTIQEKVKGPLRSSLVLYPASSSVAIAQGESEHLHALSIALGCATKTDQKENLNALCAQADAKMYADKKADPVPG